MSTTGVTETSPAPRKKPGGTRLRLMVLGGIGLAATAALAFWVHGRITNVFVYDARIAADVVSVSSRVSGWVTELTVLEGDIVEPGRLLVQIDPRESRLRLAELDAQIAALDSEEAQMVAQREMTDRLTRSRSENQRAQLTAANAALAVQQSDLDLAQKEFERATSLLERKVISRQKWENDRTRYQKAVEESRRVEAQLAGARAALLEAEAARREVRVLNKKLDSLRHRRDELIAARERQRLDLQDRTIRSAFAGVVDRTFVKQGEFVAPGQRLLMIHDPGKVWVEANVKETEIRHLRVGAVASVSVDAYPGHEFEGRVTRVGQAATSEFALLPNPNPSGNFTKITQRLPVRILLNDPGVDLRPGMMVEVVIPIE